MPEIEKLVSILKRPDCLTFESSSHAAEALSACQDTLKHSVLDGASYWHEGEEPGAATTRIKIYPTGHKAFYSPEGMRFLTTDPEGEPLNESDWQPGADGGQRLARVRMQLDSKQWIGLVPKAKSFKTEIDIKGQPGWQEMELDDLRKKAAEAWRVPFSEVKYFYNDDNIIPKGEGKYEIHLTKDSLYALGEPAFGDKKLFMSFLFTVNWEKLDLIPVVELFQSTLPGSGGACFEYIWGLHEDQSRSMKLESLRYRGLPTYPSKEAFNIFCAFFTPQAPEGTKTSDIYKIFNDPDTSHQIEWKPKPNPPWRYFSASHELTLTIQDGNLYKVSVHNDPVPIPFVNRALGGKPSCQRELTVQTNAFELIDGQRVREIPFHPVWPIKPQTDPPRPPEKVPFDWKWFFNGFPPQVDPVKALYTVPFYPEGAQEIDEASLQPMVLDQIFYYMEMSPGMPAKLEKVKKVLIHTFDTVIAGCVDCTHEREYTVLFSDPEFAQKNACLLWNYGAKRNQLDNLKKVSFLPERENIQEVYKEKYGLVFKWIPFMYFQDRDACESMLQALVNILLPEGILFLVAPKPIQGLFAHYGLECLYNDPVVNMPFFRQHLKMCPENFVNPELAVFLAEKKEVSKPEEAPPAPAEKELPGAPRPMIRDFQRKIN